jgi:putative transposase
VWAGDLTYVWPLEGWLYLAVLLALSSRAVVGWAMGPRLTGDLPEQALRMALTTRRPQAGLLHHSDRGSHGEFKWSSQHLDEGGCDEHSKAPFGSVWAATPAVTRSTVGGRPR